ncbi:MAG: PrgI family protein [Candidatus Diapherotrites archaeon]|nr:PrgI family protein [Candidatus Diapherotrites archaeon]
MPYEIPQNLKYTEKIVFGLTFWQVTWIGLFGCLAGVVFFKTNLDFAVKIAISLVFMGLGVGFAFLNLFEYLKIIKDYYSTPRIQGYFDKSLNNFVEVKDIKNDVIFLNGGSARAVIQVIPIHFAMLSGEEQKAIISAYKDFLNSLDFPIQIVMRTVNLSLTEYLAVLQKKVESTKKQGLQVQFESFKRFIQDFIKKKKIKNRLFYVIIPASPSKIDFFNLKNKPQDLKLLESQLDIRVKVCREKLKRCNLLTERLKTQELVSLVSNFFEGFFEAQNDYLSSLTVLKESENNEQNQKTEWFSASGSKQ